MRGSRGLVFPSGRISTLNPIKGIGRVFYESAPAAQRNPTHTRAKALLTSFFEAHPSRSDEDTLLLALVMVGTKFTA